MRAADIIQDAYERMNRVSPGETLSADDLAFGLRRLNLLVDELSAQAPFLYRDILTSAVQTGNITLGAGSWAAITPGSEIVSATADNVPLAPITMQQYGAIYQPGLGGTPTLFAHDGMANVYLWPTPAGQTIKLQTRQGVTAFADQTTVYTAPQGYEAALGAALAVRCAPSLLGDLPGELLRAEAKCMAAVTKYDPAIIDAISFTRGGRQPLPLF